MAWTLEEARNHWLGGQNALPLPEDLIATITVAEQARGREWVLASPLGQVYSFGKRLQTIEHFMQAVTGAPGADELKTSVLEEVVGAESELEAAHLLRSRRAETEIEFGPSIVVGTRNRKPDFRIRQKAEAWTFVEVTQLNDSTASESTQAAIERIASQVVAIQQPFILEIIFWRDPLDGEEDDLVQRACVACRLAAGERHDVGDLASLIAKSGDTTVFIPSITPDDNKARMSIARSIGGPGEPNRQIMVRVPFADQRAESALTHEAKQLPKDQPGLVMVDVRRQMTAFESWSQLIPHRFTPSQHTRVGGVLMFANTTAVTQFGAKLVTLLRLIPNPHARFPLPAWINEVVTEVRADSKAHFQAAT